MASGSRDFAPIYYRLAEELKGRICSGDYPPLSRLPIENELCRMHGTSRITIRSALKKLETEGYIHRVKGKGTFVSPARKKLRNLVVVLSGAPKSERLLQGLLAGVFMKAQEEDARIQLVSNAQFNAAIEAARHDSSMQTGVLFLRNREMDAGTAASLDKHGVPHLVEGSKGLPGCNWLDIDNNDAMRQVVDHLHNLGRKSFGIYYVKDSGLPHFDERTEATIKRLHELGVPERRIALAPFPGDGDMESMAYSLAGQLIKGRKAPEAIICHSDVLAAAVIARLERAGMRVPEDVAVTGFDDIDLCRFMKPTVTTVRQDYYELGRTAASLVFGMMDDFDGRHVRVETKLELKVRESTAGMKP